jgi:acetylglutamate/LysW-gamma-L-alpha-aminoadipate kinase
MAVNGKVNTLLVESLQRLGVNALGLSGLDGRLMAATRKDTIQSIENGKRKIIRDDYTGKIETINTRFYKPCWRPVTCRSSRRWRSARPAKP